MGLFGTDEEGQIIKGYKGPLSTYAEWHSTAIGFYHGISEHRQVPTRVLGSNSDVSKEPHMAKTGFVLGVAAKWLFVTVVVYLATVL